MHAKNLTGTIVKVKEQCNLRNSQLKSEEWVLCSYNKTEAHKFTLNQQEINITERKKTIKKFFVWYHLKMSLPSDPKMMWCMSGPEDIRGTWQLFSMTPRGVTNLTCTSCKHIEENYAKLYMKHIFILFSKESLLFIHLFFKLFYIF